MKKSSKERKEKEAWKENVGRKEKDRKKEEEKETQIGRGALGIKTTPNKPCF